MSNRPLNVGLIGGAGGSFIAHPHQKAVFFDGTRRVTAGALSKDPAKAKEQAEKWPFPITGYGSYDEMIEEESKKPKGEGLDYILIVTPNNAHFDPAKKALEKGIPVFCEKPLTMTVQESDELVRIVKEKNIPFAVAHTYVGHWTSMVSRHIVQSGWLGNIRWVDSMYLQGWLASRTEDAGIQQAEWRVDPKRAGASLCGGDIGTHALMQLRYVTGLELTRIQAHLETFVQGRQLDDHFTVFAELNNGGKAMVRATQIAIGHKNDLAIEVNGEKGTLKWYQEEPEKIEIYLDGQPDRVYWRGAIQDNDGFMKDLPEDVMSDTIIPPGHPEAFHDAFARLHRNFEKDVRDYNNGQYKGQDGSKYPTVEDGRVGMYFLEKAIESNKNGNSWVTM